MTEMRDNQCDNINKLIKNETQHDNMNENLVMDTQRNTKTSI